MSAMLLVLLPLGLLAIVSLLCFVGCSFSAAGIATYYQYQQTVLQTSGVLALWSLNEASGTIAYNGVTTADPSTNGTYLATTVPYPDDSQDALKSAPAPGTFQIGQSPGIVAGDCANGDPNQVSSCAVFDGGYVSVAANASLNPAQFSIEAWVRPDWAASDPAAFRIVAMSRDNSPPIFKGFALYARPDNVWGVSVSDGTAPLTEVKANGPFALGLTNHLVATYDGSTLVLYVDGDASSLPNLPYNPNVTKPLYIATGAPELPLRTGTAVNDPTHGPLNPFKGVIQDVAIYNRALTSTEVATHLANGNACATS
ncbi:MAG: LamG domain-containing protein [Methylobacteriaceae bacterium]|nr:LamG domain-containing protein [Methylobacteriaceae bacterium]MBV9243318.1 LamG domain-containing protein [Methylobacteriaceae bacterium]